MKLTVKNILERAGEVPRRAKGRRKAFTLLEVLIAVAALSLIAVGVASIFDATGKTIKAGRQVSAMNSYASLIEQQLRTDIAAMTREGFLVIRNEYAQATTGSIIDPNNLNVTNPNAVPLYDGDERPRLRRIDELLFFAKGQFESARRAIHPAYVARSDAAQIYYGHGQKARQPLSPSSTFPTPPADKYYKPELDGAAELAGGGGGVDEDARLGLYSANLDPPNPNRYASDWTLLRHITLLCPPRIAEVLTTATTPSKLFNIAVDSPRLQDKSVQISLQPAASNIFRALCWRFPLGQTSADLLRTEPEARYPAARSGLIDIAGTDLSVIRVIVMTARRQPNAIGDRFFLPNANGDEAQEDLNQGPDGLFRLYGPAPQDPAVLTFMQSWMNDAFPANSMGGDADRERMRYESSPRNYVGALGSTWPSQAEASYRTADQIMLSSSNFLPRCTEFIVEWSFGHSYPFNSASARDGELVWHGLTRQVGLGNLQNVSVAEPYDSSIGLHQHATPFALINAPARPHIVPSILIHGFDFSVNRPPLGGPLTSYFGYFDPTFNPDADNDGKLETGGPNPNPDAASPTIPWAWPKLIRVTLSLADPNDPSIERTFQFVFEVPEGN